MKKHLTIDFVFDEVVEDEDYTHLDLRTIKVVHSDLSTGERTGLGEEVGQTDRWQIDRWIDIQEVLGGKDKVKIK